MKGRTNTEITLEVVGRRRVFTHSDMPRLDLPDDVLWMLAPNVKWMIVRPCYAEYVAARVAMVYQPQRFTQRFSRVSPERDAISSIYRHETGESVLLHLGKYLTAIPVWVPQRFYYPPKWPQIHDEYWGCMVDHLARWEDMSNA